MDASFYFPHAFSMRSSIKANAFCAMLADLMGRNEAYGVLCKVLELLYEGNNAVDVSNQYTRAAVCHELEVDDDGLDRVLAALQGAGWIDAGPLGDGVMSSHNVQEQLDRRSAKSRAGKASGRARRNVNDQGGD